MNISAFCIRRPVFTILLMAALLVAGFAGYRTLPVSALPRVDFPTISVSASLSGASPETMASSVATPLERQFSTIAGITSMSSSSTQGSTSITIQFDLSRDIDGAALDVQTAISAASRTLPNEMTSPPSFRKVNPADQPVLFVAVSSDTLPISQVNEYADTMMAQRLSTIPGVAQVQIYGEQKYAVRIQADPDKMAAQNISFDELKNAVSAAASNAPVGIISGSRQMFNINVAGQPKDASGFRDLIAVWRNGAPVRLRDIATVSDDVENDKSAAFNNGSRAIVLAIQRQPDANTIEVVKKVRELLPVFEAEMPPSVRIIPMNDRSISVREAVHDVQLTMLFTIALVIAVIYLFLSDMRATLIPALAVPLSIIGTYGVMALMDFSINNISLLALTLCVGFVVDDAIVMMENIVRHIEDGMKPFDAALKGAGEIGFTIMSITLSLVAVFIPILFMGGVVGRIFYEFAVTISAAILLSGFISLTLTPMLCARLLRPHKGEKRSSMADRAFQKMVNGYDVTLKWCLKHGLVMLAVTFLTLAGSVYAFMIVPKGFFPQEDTGFLSGRTEGAQDISFESMVEKQKQVAEIVQADPAVANVFYSVGGGRGGAMNAGRIFMTLKPRSARDGVQKVIDRLRVSTAKVQGMSSFFQPVQNINIGGRASKSMYQYTLQAGSLQDLYKWSDTLMKGLRQKKGFTDVTSDLEVRSLQAMVTIDQEKAASFGLSNETIRRALYDAFGSVQAASLYTASNDYAVVMEVSERFRQSPEDIGKIYLRGSGDRLVPLEAIGNVMRTLGPLSVNHQGQMAAVTLSFNLEEGFSLGEAVKVIAATRGEVKMPDNITGSFQGSAQVFQESAQGQGMLIVMTVLVIYIILGMLYESFIHPITILSGLPSAGIGAVISLMLFGMDLSVIAIVGVIMLIGIVKKNAIMMIDFAVEARAQGKSAEEAIYQACLMRFRPIMMTTMAAIFGTLPIAIGVGAGAELRQPLGVSIVGGLLASQMLTLYITPVIYMYLEKLANWRRKDPDSDYSSVTSI
jgi:hydrophobic/amphiphilic exporter-1 (mainly G- bacteria), HAE1 family